MNDYDNRVPCKFMNVNEDKLQSVVFSTSRTWWEKRLYSIPINIVKQVCFGNKGRYVLVTIKFSNPKHNMNSYMERKRPTFCTISSWEFSANNAISALLPACVRVNILVYVLVRVHHSVSILGKKFSNLTCSKILIYVLLFQLPT